MLVWPGFKPTTSRSADWRSPNWANQAGVIILIYYALPDAILIRERSREWKVIDCLGSYRKRVLKKEIWIATLSAGDHDLEPASAVPKFNYAGVNMFGESLHSHYLPARDL